MIAIRSNSYTSLKDLLPDSPPASIIRGDSWREIPIKDPLVQHAAWAYLQPMATERHGNERRWSGFVEKCGGLLGCFYHVVLVIFGVGAWERAAAGGDKS